MRKEKMVKDNRGQSLVEMALIVPLLVFILVGLIEVGWAIRGYYVLLSSVREAARYAVKETTMDWNQVDKGAIGYEKVRDHFNLSLAGQIPAQVDVGSSATLIMHRIEVNVNAPCQQKPCEPLKGCQHIDEAEWWRHDDVIVTPADDPRLMQRYGAARPPRVDYDQIVADVLPVNVRINCLKEYRDQAAGSGFSPIADNIFIVEGFYDQPQILGFPVYSWMLNPVPLYTRTTIRFQNWTWLSILREKYGP